MRLGAVSAFTELKPNKTLVKNIFDALEAVAFLDQEYEMPSWFGDAEVVKNSNELVAMKNGLLPPNSHAYSA